MSIAAHPLTWNDIKGWPTDVGQRTELVMGDLVISPSPSGDHQGMLGNLIVELGLHVRALKLGRLIPGPIDVVLAKDLVYVPDVCFIAKERLEIMLEKNIQGPPDICIEVLSEINRTHDTVVKFQHYARYGVAEYWIVDQREGDISTWTNRAGEFSLFGRARSGQLVASSVLADLQLDAARILNPFEL